MLFFAILEKSNETYPLNLKFGHFFVSFFALYWSFITKPIHNRVYCYTPAKAIKPDFLILQQITLHNVLSLACTEQWGLGSSVSQCHINLWLKRRRTPVFTPTASFTEADKSPEIIISDGWCRGDILTPRSPVSATWTLGHSAHRWSFDKDVAVYSHTHNPHICAHHLVTFLSVTCSLFHHTLIHTRTYKPSG